MPKVRLRGGRYPQAFVGKNLRTNVERSDPQKVLDGDLDEFMAASLAARVGEAAKPA